MIIRMFLTFFFLIILFCGSFYGNSAWAIINILAAENIYGEVAKQIGGPYVHVSSILNNPHQDPHLFNIQPSTAKMAAQADVIIYNGADYDPWMQSLLRINADQKRAVINVAQLIGMKPGQNPHLWYKPETMPILTQYLTTMLSQRDPRHQYYFEQQLHRFANEYQMILNKISKLKNAYEGTPVIATEPIFNYMADSIGLDMHGIPFQMSIMKDIPPSISQIKAFESDLHQHKVRVLIYNNQVSNVLTTRLLAFAQKNGIPTLGVSEMLPEKITYVQWMMKQLTALEEALSGNRHE